MELNYKKLRPKAGLTILSGVIAVLHMNFYEAIGSNIRTSTITLKEGAQLEGKILNVSPTTFTLHTSKGELIIPIKSLEENSRKLMEAKVEHILKNQKAAPPKTNPKLISKVFEERELKNQNAEVGGLRIKFGRKEFIYRQFTERDQKVEYIFTPIGKTQVFDSEESIKITFNPEITEITMALDEASKVTNSLGKGTRILPNSPRKTASAGTPPQVSFGGVIEGTNGNPNKAIYGRVIAGPDETFLTIIYTYFGNKETLEETQAWFARNYERIGILMDSLDNLPSKEEINAANKINLTNPNALANPNDISLGQE